MPLVVPLSSSEPEPDSREVTIRDPIDAYRPRYPLRSMAVALAVLISLVTCACTTTGSTTTSTAAATTTTTPPTEASPTTTETLPSSTTAASVTVRTLTVPGLQAPVIDGVVGTNEWTGSTTVKMSDDSVLHWMHDGSVLYMALDSDAVGAVNLVISTGDETWVLHSSAALGSALYLPAGGAWELSHGFDWCCRTANDDSARLELLDEEGWQANIGFTGDEGTVEYEVMLPWDGASVAVSYLTDSETSAFWPSDLSSEARDQLVGPPPPVRSFNLDEWYTLAKVEP